MPLLRGKHSLLSETSRAGKIEPESMPILSRCSRRLAAVRQLLETQRLAVEAFPGIELNQVKVEGTPTLILVTGKGGF